MAFIVGDKVIEDDKEKIGAFHDRGFGEIQGDILILAPVEALYLTEIRKINILKGDAGTGGRGKGKSASKRAASSKKMYDVASLFNELKRRDKEIAVKYYVFRDLRKKGYIVKTALKFGAEFRVYDKGVKPGEDHAKWIVYPVHETSGLTWYEFAAKNRVAHSTKKRLLIGIVDEENSVTYYEIRWIRP